ncbi:MAG: Ig-like domain-containing protein, partial [Propionibacteriaceae bacterium]|nr:Ig-like domain-containing protein [Propionibacteriaceae bacterium]
GGGDEPGNTITITDENDEVVCETEVGEDGTWSCTLDDPVTDGEHEYTVTETDESGNESEPSDPIVIVVDTVSPGAPVITYPVNGSTLYTSNPMVVGTGDEVGNTITVLNGSEVVCTAVVQATKTWSCSPSTALSSGSYTFTAVETDKASNESDPSAAVTFTIRIYTSGPNAPTVTGPNGPTNNNPPTLTGGGDESGNTITITDEDGKVVCTTAVGEDGTWSCTLDDPLVDGEHELSVTETDPAGNESDPAKPIIIIDTTPPSAPIVTGPKSATNNNPPTVTGTGDEPGNVITITDGNDNVLCTTTVASDQTWSCTVKDPVTDGGYEIIVTETDEAGNISDPSDPVVIVIDTTPPPAPGVNQPENPAEVNPPTLTGTGDEEGNEITVTDEDDKVVCTTTVGEDLTWSCTLEDPLTDGEHEFTVTETDEAGNSSEESDPIVIVIVPEPMAPPVITSPANGATVTTSKPPFSGLGNGPGNTITVTDGDEIVCTATVQENGTWMCNPTSQMSDGQHTITATETDEDGNTTKPSAPVVITVNPANPSTPVVIHTNGSQVSGTADPGSTVTVFDDKGNPVPGCESLPTDSIGYFSCSPTQRPEVGTVLSVTATNEENRTSNPAYVTVVGLRAQVTYEQRLVSEQQTVTGTSFNPGEEVCVLLVSATECLTANTEGRVVFTFTVTQDYTLGNHVLTLSGQTSGSASTQYEVVSAPITPSEPSVPTGGSSMAPWWWILVAASLAVTGGALLSLRRFWV